VEAILPATVFNQAKTRGQRETLEQITAEVLDKWRLTEGQSKK